MNQYVILISSDQGIVNAAEAVYAPKARNPAFVYAYQTSKNPAGWAVYNGANWANSLGPTLGAGCKVSLSGHGNQGEIGSSGKPGDTGPDLDPQDTSALLKGAGFTTGSVVLSVCETHALYNTFAENLLNALDNPPLPAGTLTVFSPTKSLPYDRNPLSTVDMTSVTN